MAIHGETQPPAQTLGRVQVRVSIQADQEGSPQVPPRRAQHKGLRLRAQLRSSDSELCPCLDRGIDNSA
jgi:hypothetical protein